jgi:short-subunit dehydrogenase
MDQQRMLFSLPAVVWMGMSLGGCAAQSQFQPSDQPSIAGRTFVITGASSGFGRGVAVKLAGYGSNIVLAARRTEVLQDVAADVRAAGGRPLVVTTDVSKPEQVERLAKAAVGRFGRIDAWINDAGVDAIGRFEDIPLRDHGRLIDVSLKGVIYGSPAALRQFQQQRYGTIVNISSVEGKVPFAYHASYSASKSGVVGLGAALNQELRLNHQDAIKVVTVMPWTADTPFWEHTANYSGGTPRMALMDDAQTVVNAIAWVTLHPTKEVAVGGKAQFMIAAHQLLPDLTEQIAGDMVHQVQVETAPPAPPTSGTLHKPMWSGTTVEGGVRERMKREDERSREPGDRFGL